MTAREFLDTAWHEFRRGGVGGSDIAALIGLSRYSSPTKLLDHLWARTEVDMSTGCWIWQGRPQGSGYGQVSIAGRLFIVHRVGKQLLHGFDESLTLDHLCRNRVCWNPDHLEPVTLKVNILRGTSPAAVHAVQTHCIHGHEFSTENTALFTKSNGGVMRMCKSCRNKRARDRYDRQERAA